VGELVEYSIKMDMPLDSLSLEEFKEFSNLFEEDIKGVFNWDAALAHRDIEGGTGPNSIKRQIKKAKSLLKIE
jgi:argininosuccinate lyase